MNTKKTLILILICFLTIPITHKLNDQNTYTNVIITTENTQETENKPNYVFLDNGTKKILVLAGEYELADEEASFAQWRKRYLPWWGLWFFMKLIDKLWIS